MSDRNFAVVGLSELETQLVSQLAAMEYKSAYFVCAARDAERDGYFKGCTTIGDYAKALLRHRLNYLEKI